jgi:hypothetical protein
MWQLILGVYPDQPPQCSQIEIMGVPFWTYGGLLLYDTSEATQRIDFDRMYIPYLFSYPRAVTRTLSHHPVRTRSYCTDQFDRSALLCSRMYVAPSRIQAYYDGA